MYVEKSVTLSPGQLKKLAGSEPVRFTYDDLTGHSGGEKQVLHLTKQQARKIETAVRKQKGLTLTLSQKQVHKSAQSGGSLKSFIADHLVKGFVEDKLPLRRSPLQRELEKPVARGAEWLYNRLVRPVGDRLLKQAK